MNQMNFKKGHFVMLKEPQKYNFTYPLLETPLNICTITDIDIKKNSIRLKECDSLVNFNDISPIPINGKDDRWIYANYITLPYVYLPSNPKPKIPSHSIDYSYYLRRVKFNNDNKLSDEDFIKKYNFKYVHEIQEYLYEALKECPLTINYFRTT